MRNSVKIVTLLTLPLILLYCSFSSNKEPLKKIYISQIINHPALDSTIKGIIYELEANGYYNKKNLELKVESAQGSSLILAQIANNFVSNNPDVVVGVSTLSAQSFMKFAKIGKVKVVFSSVTDPLSANLLENLEVPEGNITGVSNFIEIEPQINYFLKALPNLKKLGFLYDPAESNSIYLLSKLKNICIGKEIQIIEQVATKASEIPQAANNLVDQVDAIFISNDSTALAAIDTIINVANTKSIPVFVSDTDLISRGALLAYGPNQFEIGRQTGRMIIRIFKGEAISDIKVEYPSLNELYVNMDSAKKLGINIDEETLKQAIKYMDKK